MQTKENIKLDFVGIGAGKCATTWIYECLREHPEISILPKEGQIFANDNFQEIINRFFAKKQNKAEIKGDFSVWYLDPEMALRSAENIKKHNSEIKIIASLRNPIDRAYSQYFQYLYDSQKGLAKTIDFEEAIKKFPKKILGTGLYYQNLKKYFNLFPKKNILILFYDEIKQKPKETIKKIYQFLKIKPIFAPSIINQQAGSTKFKQTKFHQLIHQISKPILKTNSGRKIKNSLVVKRTYYHLINLYLKYIPSSVPPMKPETRKYLQQVFAEDIKNLEKLIERDLSFWK